MKKYGTMFLTYLLMIGMAINVRTDIPFWKQLIGYMVIAAIAPFAQFLADMHQVPTEQENN